MIKHHLALTIFIILCLAAALGILAWGMSLTTGLAMPRLGLIKYIWIGGFLMLAALIGFFIWLIGKGK